jgi:hypothetical protein
MSTINGSGSGLGEQQNTVHSTCSYYSLLPTYLRIAAAALPVQQENDLHIVLASGPSFSSSTVFTLLRKYRNWQ